MRWVSRSVVALALTGCPTAKDKQEPHRDGKCTAFGERCALAPGKVGACVIRDGCTGDGCLVCQPQH